MKILDISDELLSSLNQRFSRSNLVRHLEGNRYPEYKIPFELIKNRSDYRIKHYRKDDEGIWVSSSKLKCALRQFTGLTVQEFYDLLFLRINDTELRPRCKYCGKPKGFDKISHGGYGTEFRGYTFCSPSCSTMYVWYHQDEYPNVVSHFQNGSGFGTLMGNLNAKRSNFLNMCNAKGKDRADFYIASTLDNKFKFGISINARVQGWHKDYKNRKCILTSDPCTIAELEYNIKLDFGGREYLEWSEVFDFIRSYIKYTKSI